MAQTVVGLFDSFSEAQSVVRELESSGFDHNDVSVVANNTSGEYGGSNDNSALGNNENVGNQKMDNNAAEQAGSGALAGTGVGAGLGLLAGLAALAIPGIGPVVAAGPIAAALGVGGATVAGATALGAGLGAASGALVGPLVEAGVPRPEAELYHEGVRRGGALVTVRTEDSSEAQRAADIMSRYNVIDIDERGSQYRSSGYSGFDTNAEPYTREQMDTFRTSTTSTAGMTSGTMDTTNRTTSTDADAVLPVIEEEIQVGKRQVQRGGARIHTVVTERPIEEQVTLREEHVNIERRPVNREVSSADLDAFREQTIEMTETSEEAVVAKRARVVEEVVIDKDVTERTETIRDSVRRTDVEVENLGTQTTGTSVTSGTSMSSSTTDFSAFDNDFRTHYQSSYGNSGMNYDAYGPVYRYGYNIANDARYSDRDFDSIESDVRTRWEERNPNTWDQFKDGIRYAYDKARGRR